MAQHDYDVANGTGAAVRADLNSVLDAIVSLNSGTSAPTTTFAYQLWYDTTVGVLRIRNSSNTAWLLFSATQTGYATVATDADFTLTPITSAPNQRHTGTLTANRAITLSTTNAYAGMKFRITRTGTGAFNLSVGGLKNLTTNTWCEVTFDGTAWYLSAYGTL